MLDLAKDGVPAPVELRCLTGRSAYPWDKADYIVSLGGAYLPFSDTFEDLTPPGLTLASVWRQKDPSSLRLRHLVTASVNEVLSFTEGENNFRRFPVSGFSYTEENWTWSNGNESVISMVLGAKVQDYTYLVVTWSRAMTLGNQLCRVEVNGSVVFEGSLAGEGDQDLWIPTTVLGEEGILDLHFFFPTALHSDEGDPRLLAVAFTSLELSVEE